MKFSQAKFTGLPPLRQLRKVLTLCRQVEQHWQRHGTPDGEDLAELHRLVEWTTAPLPPGFTLPPDGATLAAFVTGVRPLYDNLGYEPDDAALDIPLRGKSQSQRHTIPLTVVLVDLRSAFNVGGIIRTAECVGAQEVVTCGSTPPATHSKVMRTAMGTQEAVPCRHELDTLAALRALREQGTMLLALETGWDVPDLHEFKVPRPCAVVVGNEALGLPPEVLALCQHQVQLPVHGMKNSLNVGVALGACVYEILRQWSR